MHGIQASGHDGVDVAAARSSQPFSGIGTAIDAGVDAAMHDALPIREHEAPAAAPTTGIVRVITGHYGSGKTEFAVSLAMRLAAAGRGVALCDLDIVNPYFRSREQADLMEAQGIRVISSKLGHVTTLDLPAISPAVREPIGDPALDVILDVGGDANGAKALVEFGRDIRHRGYEMLLVVNAYRPETPDVAAVLHQRAAIEESCGLSFTGLISNTHLMRETTRDDVLTGYALTKAVSERTGLPICYVSAIPAALDGLPDELHDVLLPIGLFMRPAWM